MVNSWESLLDQHDERIRRAFLESIKNLRDRAQIDQIARMLEAGNVEGALRAVGLDPASFRPFDKAIAEAFEAGGEATAKLVPITQNAEGFRTVFQFGIRNPMAEAWLANHSSTLVREIVDDQRSMIRNNLTDAMSKGLNPRTAALDLVGRVSKVTGKREGGFIGLTSSQEAWVRNYAEELASDTPTDALTRALRDKRFDAAVLRAEKNGTPIPADTRAKMVAAYKNRAMRYRAESIARTEAMAALHQSQEEAIRQAVEQGAVPPRSIAYVWRTARDKRVRDTHQTMEGQRRAIGEPFETGSGAHLMFPGDPNGPPAETINCRCFRMPDIDFLAGAL